MTKGQFAPGKRVLVLGPCKNPLAIHVVGTECRLGSFVTNFFDGVDRWELAGKTAKNGEPIAWAASQLILLDPDETPEQSAEAMRDLMQTKKEKETT